MHSGYTGKILRVDLSSGNMTHFPTVDYAERFLGGRGIGAKIYWDEVSPDVKAFDAENRLFFLTGPLTGFTRLSGSRLQICGKSPATFPETFSYSSIGGSWGSMLKFSGFDGIVIHGKSEKPVYLLIRDGVAEIKDASSHWGRSTVETREILKNEYGNSARVLAIGPAGENMVNFATALSDDDSSASSGFGALMGSKKLKAIVLIGTGKVVAANPERLRKLTEHLARFTRDTMKTPPTFFKSFYKRHACYGCIAGCLRQIYRASDGETGKFMCQSGAFYKGPALRYYGKPTEVPFYANRLCDKYGLDTMVIGPMILWITRCGQEGILTSKDTGIPLVKFGSLEFIESVVRKISSKEGFGSILAQGINKAADIVGHGSKELIGDLVFPRTGQTYVYDPRMYITAALFYATEPRQPIQHLHEVAMLMLNWYEWYQGVEDAYVSTDLVRAIARRFWGSDDAADFSTYTGKALAAKKIQDREYAKECLILCDYAWPFTHIKHSMDHIGDPALESEILSAIIGKEIDENGLNGIGERVLNIQRAIFIREGHKGRESDSLPEFSYSLPLQFQQYNPECLLPGEGGKVISRKGAVVARDQFEKMKDEYYHLRGWDVTTGLPTIPKLQQLGLLDVAHGLQDLDFYNTSYIDNCH